MRSTLCAILALAACAGPAPTPSDTGHEAFDTDRELTLAVGQTATFRGTDIAVRFEAVVGDSRCPSDVQCVWAGTATVALRLSNDEATEDLELTLRSPAQGDSRLEGRFAGFRFALTGVSPYPETAGVPIPTAEYRIRVGAAPIEAGETP